MRTTVDIDSPVLREIKTIQAQEHKSLGRVVSDLLLIALRQRRSRRAREPRTLTWIAKPMDARVDLADRDAIYDAMDEDSRE